MRQCALKVRSYYNLCMDGYHGFCCSGGGAVTNQVPVEDMVESVWLQGWLSTVVDPTWSWSPIEAEADNSLLQLFLRLELGESKSATKDNVV